MLRLPTPHRSSLPLALLLAATLVAGGCASSGSGDSRNAREYVAPLDMVIEQAEQAFSRSGLYFEESEALENGMFALRGSAMERSAETDEPVRAGRIVVTLMPISPTATRVQVEATDTQRASRMAYSASAPTSNFARRYLRALDNLME